MWWWKVFGVGERWCGESFGERGRNEGRSKGRSEPAVKGRKEEFCLSDSAEPEEFSKAQPNQVDISREGMNDEGMIRRLKRKRKGEGVLRRRVKEGR